MKATDPLQKLKNRVIAHITPYWNRVSSKDFKDLKDHLKSCSTRLEVEGYYKVWQQKLAFKNIATLPDLNQKPGQKAAA